ncbi:MAG: hypothetical protein JNK99_00340 [Candidatus Accumulibacter sp.]|uniref:DUF6519 domain-containing protein n=1 Tax=Accumulibacter sp. TaxID=2053492 RepID=UPI001A628F90|nr:DUF6519 domain-containing protein [Accumulibacter sp.]MBL8393185.1 hypothetical protein [Accumulibacter sp.]
MKTQISRDTFQPARNYSGVQLQQGRMIVDADWNELSDIVRARLETALADAVSSGAPCVGGLELFLSGANLRIRPGRIYVEGVPAAISGPSSGIVLTAQPDYPNSPALPAAGDLRFYADLWERSVTALEDSELMDPGLHGADTAARSQTMLQVKWCDPALNPSDATINPPLGNAPLSLQLRSIAAAGDPCDPCAAEVEVDERIGNYLFRVEVHAVERSGADTLVTLKWSRDNGAEAYAVGATPAGFGQGSWAWEFFDAASERQLGNHLTSGFQARRGILAENFTVPAGATDPKAFVRQWDGFATINLGSNTLLGGLDRGTTLSAALAADAHGRVDIAGGTFSANLELLEIDLAYAGRSFVPGDYWLATVREAVQSSGDLVLDAQPPRGPRHHYLELGRRIGGALLPPPGITADAHRRRLHFPSLANLTAADVAFSEPAGCSGLYAGAPNVQEALARICQIGAANVGVTLPTPLPANTVASLLATQLGAGWPDLDGQPRTPSVQDMLQALLLTANAAALPYTVPTCGTPAAPTVRSLLNLTPGPSQVDAVLQQLLCNLSGDRLPLNPATLTCPDLINSGETTLQGGLDFLCRTRLTSCAVTVPVGQLETLLRDFAAGNVSDLWLCLLPGEHRIEAALTISGKRSLRISAAAAGASALRVVTGVLSLEAQELGLEGIGAICVTASRVVLRANRMVANRCTFSRNSSSDSLPPMVRIEALSNGAELIWRDNVMSDTWSRPVEAGGGFDVFNPDLVGNAAVVAAANNIRNNPGIYQDAVLYEQAAIQLTNAVNGMTGAERLAWRDRVNNAPREAARAAGLDEPLGRAALINNALLIDSQPLLANASFGVRDRFETQSSFVGSIDRINAAAGNAAAVRAEMDELVAILFEFGYGVALGVASNQLSGSLTDNHFDGELLLMNGLNSGLDPQDVTIAARSGTVANSVGSATGHLSLTGNRIQRLWARLPNGSVGNNTLLQTVPGYASLSLSSNQFFEFGHSVVAAVLTVQGNRFIDGGSGSRSIARLLGNRTAITGNVAAAGNEAAVITVVGPSMAASANLVSINRV